MAKTAEAGRPAPREAEANQGRGGLIGALIVNCGFPFAVVYATQLAGLPFTPESAASAAGIASGVIAGLREIAEIRQIRPDPRDRTPGDFARVLVKSAAYGVLTGGATWLTSQRAANELGWRILNGVQHLMPSGQLSPEGVFMLPLAGIPLVSEPDSVVIEGELFPTQEAPSSP